MPDADFVKKYIRTKATQSDGEEFKSRIERLQEKFKKKEVKIYKPESEFPELVVVVPDSWNTIQLAPLFDVHIGSGDHDAELFQRHLDWIARTPGVLSWNGGDMVENAVKDSPGASSLVQKGTPNEQLFRAAKQLAPIQHKMLFAIPGNHEDRTFNVAGLDGAEQLAEHLKLPYFPDYCVSPETKILTADLRWIPAKDIEIGQALVGFDEQVEAFPKRGRCWRKAVVTEKAFLKRPCYRIEMEDGTTLTSSSEHMWVSYVGSATQWKTTEELYRCMKHSGRSGLLKVLEPWEEISGYDVGYLAAAFDGEGCHTQATGKKRAAHSLTFSQKPNAMLSFVKDKITSLGFSWGTNTRTWGVETVGIRGGLQPQWKFLGQIRPKRLLAKFDPELAGRMEKVARVKIRKIEPIGEQWVVSLTTSTRTFVAEGFASHNCFLTIKWRGNAFRVCVHHGSGAAQTAGAQRNAARKDMPWTSFDVIWTGHLHQPMVDVVYRTDFDQSTGQMYERSSVVIISPSYVKYFGGYAAKKRMAPGARGLIAAELNPDGRIDVSLHARGKRL